MAVVSFDAVAPLIIAAESGYEIHKSDYGKATKYGISQRQYPKIDIKSLTSQQALMLLEADYWVHYHVFEIKDQLIANQIFFLFVNMDPVAATKIIQLAVNAVGRGIVSTKIDGVFGSGTRLAINSLSPYWLSDRIRVEECRYYLELVDRDTSQSVNFRGWIRRALDVRRNKYAG